MASATNVRTQTFESGMEDISSVRTARRSWWPRRARALWSPRRERNELAAFELGLGSSLRRLSRGDRIHRARERAVQDLVRPLRRIPWEELVCNLGEVPRPQTLPPFMDGSFPLPSA